MARQTYRQWHARIRELRRQQVFARDYGICAVCGCDTEKIHRVLAYAYRHRFEQLGIEARLGFKPLQSYWEADHILERVRGGGNALSNIQTLCVPCHKVKTKKLAEQRAQERRAVRHDLLTIATATVINQQLQLTRKETDMRMNDAFPSEYLKAADMEDEDMTLTIKGCDFEEFPDQKTGKKEAKPVLRFRETELKLVCNRTNFATIAKVLDSDESDDWIGKRITFYATEVDAWGETKLAIRVRVRAPKPAGQAKSQPVEAEDSPPPRQRQPARQLAEADEVPF